MIVAARQSAYQQAALSTGHYAEVFARTKRLKPLAKLLAPDEPPSSKSAAGAAKVGAMFRRMKAAQEPRG